MNEFHDWLAARGIDPATLSDPVRTQLQAAWRADLAGPAPPPSPAPAAAGGDDGPAAGGGDDQPFDEKMKAIEAESERVARIKQAGERVMTEFARVGNTAKVNQIAELVRAAVADPKVDARTFDYSLMRIGRADVSYGGVAAHEPQATAKVIEAAVCRFGGLDNLEKAYDPATLEAADRHFRGGMGLVDLVAHFARRNGWRGHLTRGSIQSKDFLKAAFGGGPHEGGGQYDMAAAVTGPSTYSLPNILGNIANKFLKSGFDAVDTTWMRISARRSVNDFKTTTAAALTGGLMYKNLAPSGEIKHGTIGETTYTNRASTYAIMLGIERTDLINDDLGALSQAGRRVGRGGALKINDLFWTAFLNNSSFFTSGNLNVSTGGGSALGTADGAAINAAEVKFMNQTDPDGYPVAVRPRVMLVPPTLLNTAARWMGSQVFTNGGTNGLGSTNVFAGRYSVESSPYMENTTYTGNSTAAWYLLADPNDLPVIEGVAVNGKWEPTVETADADFNHLGIAMRGYLDVGFALQEYRGGVRSAGS